VNIVIRFLVLLFCFEGSFWCLVTALRLCEFLEAAGTVILQKRPSVTYTGAFYKAMEVSPEDDTIVPKHIINNEKLKELSQKLSNQTFSNKYSLMLPAVVLQLHVFSRALCAGAMDLRVICIKDFPSFLRGSFMQ
jgi:hypothetical protein